jgi:hypothetical protein
LDRCEIFHGSVICGPHSRFFAIDTATELNVVGVHFKAGGAYPFLKVPSGQLHNLHVGLDALWGRAAAGEMRERLLAAGTPEAKTRVLEQSLMAAAGGVPERHPAVAFALNAFHEVAEQIGLARGDLSRCFARKLGCRRNCFAACGGFRRCCG